MENGLGLFVALALKMCALSGNNVAAVQHSRNLKRARKKERESKRQTNIKYEIRRM